MYRLVIITLLLAACAPATQRAQTNPRLLAPGYCFAGDCPDAARYRVPTPRAAAIISRL